MEKNEMTIVSNWLEKLLCVDFKGKSIVIEQLNHSSMSFNQHYAYISIKFCVQSDCPRFEYNVRVPVEMVEWQRNSVPIIFLLHIVDGFLDELEVVMMDSTKIDIYDVQLNNLEFDIDEAVAL